MTRVHLFPNGGTAELGAERWQAEWQELTATAQKRYDADPDYEHDRDRDQVDVRSYHKTQAAAVAAAQVVVNSGQTVYGAVQVRLQRVDWCVREDNLGEWIDVGESTEVTADNR
jgi:hypothetical protein